MRNSLSEIGLFLLLCIALLLSACSGRGTSVDQEGKQATSDESITKSIDDTDTTPKETVEEATYPERGIHGDRFYTALSETSRESAIKFVCDFVASLEFGITDEHMIIYYVNQDDYDYATDICDSKLVSAEQYQPGLVAVVSSVVEGNHGALPVRGDPDGKQHFLDFYLIRESESSEWTMLTYGF